MKIDYTFVVVNLLNLPIDVRRHIKNADDSFEPQTKPAMKSLTKFVKKVCRFIKEKEMTEDFKESIAFEKDPQYRHLCINFTHRLLCLLNHAPTIQLLSNIHYTPTKDIELTRLKLTMMDLVGLQKMLIEKECEVGIELQSMLFNHFKELVDGEYTAFDLIILDVVATSVINCFAMATEQQGIGKLIDAADHHNWVDVTDVRPSRQDKLFTQLASINKSIM